MEEEQSKTELEILLVNKGIYEEAKNLELQKLDKEILREKAKKSSQSSMIQKGILVALIGLIATIFGAIINGNNSKKIEEQQHYSNLISKALEVSESEPYKLAKTAENLNFLISSGLLKGKVKDSIKNLIYAPNHIEAQKILKNFNNAKNTNIASDFAIRAKFDYNISVTQDSKLTVTLTNVYIAQLRARAIYPVNIHNIRLLLTAVNLEGNSFEVYSSSNSHPINKTFDTVYFEKLDKVDFILDIEDLDREYDGYSMTLEISEFYNGTIGTSYAHSFDYVGIRP